MMTEIQNAGKDFTLDDSNEGHKAWKEVLNLGENATAQDFVSASKSAGDSVLTRVYSHVKNDGGRIDEQIDGKMYEIIDEQIEVQIDKK